MDVTLGLGSVIGGAVGAIGENKRHKRQKEYMGMQQTNVLEQMEKAKEHQMQMWNDTNYGAQLEHMKEAGLNPALMYGMGGGGGTTAGAGTAGSAGLPQAPTMDIAGNAMQGAQIALTKAQADKLEAETEKTKEDTKLTEREILKLSDEMIDAITEDYIAGASTKREEARRLELANKFETWMQKEEIQADGSVGMSPREKQARYEINKMNAEIQAINKKMEHTINLMTLNNTKIKEINQNTALKQQLKQQLDKINPVELDQLIQNIEYQKEHLEILKRDPANKQWGQYIDFGINQGSKVMSTLLDIRKVKH